MPQKNPNTRRFGGPGSSRQDRDQPEKFEVREKIIQAEAATNGRSSKISGGGGERDKHHSHDPQYKS